MILRPHPKLNRMNLINVQLPLEWMNSAWWKSPSLWDRWVLGASLASVSESSGRGPLWEPAPQCRGLPRSQPMVTAFGKAPGKGSFHLLKPHPPTGCCKNHPDSPSCWYGADDKVSERSLAGVWHLLHFSYVTHVGAREHKGMCVRSGSRAPGFRFRLAGSLAVCLWASYITSLYLSFHLQKRKSNSTYHIQLM